MAQEKMQVVKEVKASNNLESSFFMSLSYSIAREDFSKIWFKVAMPSSALATGIIWGSMRVELLLKFHEEANVSTTLSTTGCSFMNQSVAYPPGHNPDKLDLTITGKSYQELTMMAKRGELKDFSSHKGHQDLVKFEGSVAGSSIRGSEEGSSVDSKLARNLAMAKTNKGKENKTITNYLANIESLRNSREGSIEEESDDDLKKDQEEQDAHEKKKKSVGFTLPTLNSPRKTSQGKKIEVPAEKGKAKEKSTVKPVEDGVPKVEDFKGPKTSLSDVIFQIFPDFLMTGYEKRVSDFINLRDVIREADDATKHTKIHYIVDRQDSSNNKVSLIHFDKSMSGSLATFAVSEEETIFL